jgi:hypothetical protein
VILIRGCLRLSVANYEILYHYLYTIFLNGIYFFPHTGLYSLCFSNAYYTTY